MSKTPFMPLWVSDFLGDTLDLDAAEIGAYMLLLMAQWNRDGDSLPNDDAKLRRVARCGRNWPKIWDTIGRYFEHDEAGVYSPRLRLEAQNVAAKREVNAHNGARGGRAKALKNNEQPLANATVSLQRNPSIPEPYKIEAKASSIHKARLPADWVPGDVETQYALSKNLTHDEIREMANEFAAYWSERADKAGRKSANGWNLTWQGHVRRNAYQFIRSRSNGTGNGARLGGGATPAEIADSATQWAANRAQRG